MKTLVLFVILLSLGNTAQAAKLQKFRWSPKTWKPTNLFLPIPVKSISSTVNIGLIRSNANFIKGPNELISKSSQFIDGAKVDGSWQQVVYSPTGQVLYAVGAVLDNIPDTIKAKIPLMKINADFARSKLAEQSYEYRIASRVYGPDVEITNLSGVVEPVWTFRFVTKHQDKVFRARIRENGTLLDMITIESSFADGKALAYPSGPKLSGLSEVLLPNLVGDGSLSGLKLSVHSAQNAPVFAPNLIFNFETNDRRFDQVQVYYYVAKALTWFKEVLQADLTAPLLARVHVGENGVSNAAFYHDNVIYLGTGDGVTYKEMLKDPSIVMHEASHALIDAFTGLPSDGEGGSFNEGFADFFAAIMLDNPNMAEASYLKAPFRRSLKNNLKAYVDFGAGVYKNGSIIGGTLWDIRERIGSERASLLAFKTLVRLGSGAKFNDFLPAVVHACSTMCSDTETKMVEEALANRGWKMMQDEAL